MLCKDCEHFKIIQEPLKVGRDVYDCGVAECSKYDLYTEFTHKGKFKWLTCVEDESSDECCNNCAYQLEIEQLDYTVGCKHTDMDGYACMGLFCDGIVYWVINNDGNGICEMYKPKAVKKGD